MKIRPFLGKQSKVPLLSFRQSAHFALYDGPRKFKKETHVKDNKALHLMGAPLVKWVKIKKKHFHYHYWLPKYAKNVSLWKFDDRMRLVISWCVMDLCAKTVNWAIIDRYKSHSKYCSTTKKGGKRVVNQPFLLWLDVLQSEIVL